MEGPAGSAQEQTSVTTSWFSPITILKPNTTTTVLLVTSLFMQHITHLLDVAHRLS